VLAAKLKEKADDDEYIFNFEKRLNYAREGRHTACITLNSNYGVYAYRWLSNMSMHHSIFRTKTKTNF
jgi:hypothetical protein